MDNLAIKCDLDNMLLDKDTEPKALPFSLLEKITDGFSHMKQIGRGGFAEVYKGMLPNGAVAVKRLSNTDMYEKEFLGEIECLMKVKHKNIVRFLGYCSDTQQDKDVYNGRLDTVDTRQRILCFEYLRKASLDCYIKGSFGGLEWRNRYKIIKEICEGLNYLHQQNIMHIDLKPTNIFLDENMIPKIADFALSRRYREDQKPVLTTKVGGNMEYLAPEFTGRVTHNFDLYNLGVIIIEILAGEMGRQVVEKALQSLSNDPDTSQWEQVQVCAEIAIQCIDIDPAKRPMSIKHIIDKLLETESTQFPIGRPRELLLLHQFVLCFPFEPNKVITRPLQLTNSTHKYVAFRLTDKSEESFLKLPSYGIVPPKSSYILDVTTQEHKELPRKSNTNLILDSAIVSPDDYMDNFQGQDEDFFEKAIKTENVVQVTLKAFYSPRREMTYSSKMGSKPHNMSIQQTGSSSDHVTLQHLKDITNNFSAEKILGRGGFSVVYKGELQCGEVVAVKKLVRAMPGSQKQFENEVNLLMNLKLHHPNIVRPVNYYYERQHLHKLHEGEIVCARNTEFFLFLEYLCNGSLDNYISGASSGLDWHTRWKIIKGISSGLHYLHEKLNTPIIHLDLKPSNILLDEDMVPKIADFGLSRLLDQKQTSSNVMTSGTFGYMPPEYLLQGIATPMSDIFSLGVIIIQLITGHRDYPSDIGTSSKGFIEHELQNWRNVLQKGQEYTSLEIDLQQIKRCIEIGLFCVDLERTKRPTIKKVVDMLQGLESTELNVNNEEETKAKIISGNSVHTTRTTTTTATTASVSLPPKCRNIDDDDEGFLLPEFSEMVMEELGRDVGDVGTSPAPRVREDAPSEHEIYKLRDLVRSLQERENTLEMQLVELYGLQEQDAAVRELENQQKINNVESKLYSLKVEALQSENQRLQTQLSESSKLASELETTKSKYKLLKKKLRLDAEQAKEKITSLQKIVDSFQCKETNAEGEIDAEVEKKLKRLEELENEARELRAANSRLQHENSHLIRRLELTRLPAVHKSHHSTEVKASEEAVGLKQENEKLSKEVEQLQTDRFAYVEEMVYLKWVNACLRDELKNNGSPGAQTCARDLSNTLSPKSEETTKLIMEYSNVGTDKGRLRSIEFGSEYASSRVSSRGDPDGASIDMSSVTKHANPKKKEKKKFFATWKR